MNTYPLSNGDPGDPEPFCEMTGPMPMVESVSWATSNPDWAPLADDQEVQNPGGLVNWRWLKRNPPMPLTQPTEGSRPTEGVAGSGLREIMGKLAAEHAATTDGEMDLLWSRLTKVSQEFADASERLDKITDSVLAIQYRLRGER